MGWNTIAAPDGSALFAGIEAGTRFYFVHSYALRMRDAQPLLDAGADDHRDRARRAVRRRRRAGVVAATQFHPEKSGDAGAQVSATGWACLPRQPRMPGANRAPTPEFPFIA